MLSFVYDIADLYKADITIPLVFYTTAEAETNLASRIQRACRDMCQSERILQRIIPDIERALNVPTPENEAVDFDVDAAASGGLRDPETGITNGDVNWDEFEER